MTYPDPFEDTSPWDSPREARPQSPAEPPQRQTDTPAALASAAPPFKIGFTLKSASGFEAEWLTPTVYGHTAEETAQRGAELLTSMKSAGLIDLAAKAAEYTRSQHRGVGSGRERRRFENGKVVPAQQTEAPTPDDSCPHGERKLVDKGTWAALFCQAHEKADQCEPLWRQKDGSFRAR